MRRKIITALCLLSLTSAAPAPPRRIVSLNTCADQYVLALADPAQIAALSPYGHDPELSAAVAKARHFRTLKRPAEEVLAIRPDLLIGFPDGAGGVVGAPPGRSRKLGLASADSFASIRAQIRQVAAAVGHRERGEALIRAMERDLAALPRTRRGGVAYLQYSFAPRLYIFNAFLQTLIGLYEDDALIGQGRRQLEAEKTEWTRMTAIMQAMLEGEAR